MIKLLAAAFILFSAYVVKQQNTTAIAATTDITYAVAHK